MSSPKDVYTNPKRGGASRQFWSSVAEKMDEKWEASHFFGRVSYHPGRLDAILSIL
jgi:hypothetical protein